MSKSPFLESIRTEIRTRQYSYRTEKSYLYWVRQFILFNEKQHPEKTEVKKSRSPKSFDRIPDPDASMNDIKRKTERNELKPLLCLDLEGTLISNAVSQIPRPGLDQFLARVSDLCDLVIYTSVNVERATAIQKLLVNEKAAPPWFQDLDVIRPVGTLKHKVECGREWAYLLDDQAGVIAPGEEDWWIPISEYQPPYPEDDRALPQAIENIEIRIRLLEPSERIDLGDL